MNVAYNIKQAVLENMGSTTDNNHFVDFSHLNTQQTKSKSTLNKESSHLKHSPISSVKRTIFASLVFK